MPKLWGRQVKITRVDENTVEVVHVRQRGARRLRDASYTTTDKRNPNIRRDHVVIDRKQAKRQGLLSKLFGSGSDDDDAKQRRRGGLDIGW